MFRSFFKNLSNDASFRERVLKAARKMYPEVVFEAPANDPVVVVANEFQIGLGNLKAKFEQSDRSQEAFEALVEEHINLIFQGEPVVPDFSLARPKLRPQLMPSGYGERTPLIAFPFGRTLAIGIVMDSENAYSYLKCEDAERWNRSHGELLEVATANLDEASRKMPMQFMSKDETNWVGIEMKDGFDAARIVLPKLREFLASRLGSPFRFGVPNRDFLICWNAGASAEFVEGTATKLRNDFEEQPYPLSPYVFEVSADGTFTEMTE